MRSAMHEKDDEKPWKLQCKILTQSRTIGEQGFDENFNASRMTTISMKNLNEKLKLSQTFLTINSQQPWM
jgi:hypothetical protein